ncbi:MAG: hypothetical protein WCI05_14490, partial [Myxococcales bacterium]
DPGGNGTVSSKSGCSVGGTDRSGGVGMGWIGIAALVCGGSRFRRRAVRSSAKPSDVDGGLR